MLAVANLQSAPFFKKKKKHHPAGLSENDLSCDFVSQKAAHSWQRFRKSCVSLFGVSDEDVLKMYQPIRHPILHLLSKLNGASNPKQPHNTSNNKTPGSSQHTVASEAWISQPAPWGLKHDGWGMVRTVGWQYRPWTPPHLRRTSV